MLQTRSKVTLKDVSLSQFSLANLPRVKTLRNQHFATPTEVCIERAKYITEYLEYMADAMEPPVIQRARAICHYLSNRKAFFADENPIAGSTTSKKIGAPLYPELLGLTIWPELETISKRKVNPQLLNREEIDQLNFEIFPFWMDRNVLEVTRREYHNPLCLQLMEKLVFYISGKAGCISHCVPGYDNVLNKGLEAIIEELILKEKMLSAPEADEEHQNQKHFYHAVQICLQGILNYAHNLENKAAELAALTHDPHRRAEYQGLAQVLARVPAGPAGTFREAVNALWICQVGIHAENINMAMSPGRLDQILFPYYQRDLEAGRITVGEALELACCLWLKIADNTNLVPEAAEKLWGGAGSTPAVTLGGIDRDGHDAVNDLTYIFLKATELMSLRDPSVNARYHYEVNDRSYRQRVCQVIASTRAIPAFHNDKADIDSLVNQGVSLPDARDFAIVGCVELAATGRDYVSSSSIMFNLVAPLEMALFNGKRKVTGNLQVGPLSGDPTGFKDFEQFWQAFTSQLHWLIEQAIKLNEFFGRVHQKILPTPLLSAFFEGPMETGRDLVNGGARYNSSGASHVAFPDVVDSLIAIRYVVFDKKILTMAEMLEAIRTDFSAPYDRYLDLLRHKTPKFGTEHPIALEMASRLVDDLYQVYSTHKNYRGGPYRPAFWTMTTHAGQGRLAGALPNGRRAGEVFSSGITPASQAARELIPALNAVAALNPNHMPGGEALNIKYNPPAEETKEEWLERFGQVVEGYFRQGGMQVQFNILDYETLINAKAHPERYPELIVRVSGYSAYFKDLSDAMKDELITRSQYDLLQGSLQPLPNTWQGGDS